MPLKLNALPDIRFKIDELIQAIKDYQQDKDFDSVELERAIDKLLCDLPRDIIYVEWFDRSDIKNMADGVFDEPATEDLVDMCMEDLDRFNGSFMENESIQMCVNETVRYAHEHKGDNNDD